jgi:hypothetical protein
MVRTEMSSASRRAFRRTLISATATLLSCACGHPTVSHQTSPESTAVRQSAQFPNWPNELNDFRFHWSAEPSVDLASGPAVALRAYLESYRVVNLTGGDADTVYPGFLRATPENQPSSLGSDSLLQLTYVRPHSRAEAEASGWKYVRRQIYGYEPAHVLKLEPTADAYRATVCVGTYSVYRTDDNDHQKYFSVIADPKSGNLQYGGREIVDVWRIELTDKDPRTHAAPSGPVTPQIGPLPAPAQDVFGRWFITGATTGLWGPSGTAEQIDTPEVRKQCEDSMPDDAATRAAMAAGFHDAPPPHGDPIPGWPAANP